MQIGKAKVGAHPTLRASQGKRILVRSAWKRSLSALAIIQYNTQAKSIVFSNPIAGEEPGGRSEHKVYSGDCSTLRLLYLTQSAV